MHLGESGGSADVSVRVPDRAGVWTKGILIVGGVGLVAAVVWSLVHSPCRVAEQRFFEMRSRCNDREKQRIAAWIHNDAQNMGCEWAWAWGRGG